MILFANSFDSIKLIYFSLFFIISLSPLAKNNNPSKVIILCFSQAIYKHVFIIYCEIIICPAQAKKQAKEFKQSYQKEIIKLVLHGYLHVIGFDHEKEVEAREMEKLERRVLGYGA